MRYLGLVLIRLLVMCGIGVSSHAGTITQADFVERLKQTHPLFEREKLTAQIEQHSRDSYLGSQDWNIQSSVLYCHDEPSFAIAGPERTDAIAITGGLEKALWSTGGRLSASFSSSYANLKLDPFLGIPDSYFENGLQVSYSHPLRRNRRGVLDRLQYDLKQFDIDLSEVMALENEEDFVARSVSRFLDWVFLTEQRRIVSDRLSLSEEELIRTRQKRDANLVDKVDVIRAEDAVLIARQNLMLVESRWKALQSELAVLLQDSSYYQATPQHDLYQTIARPSREVVLAELRADSRLLKTLRIRAEQLATVRLGYVEQGKADLSLIAQLGLKNAEPAFGRSLAMDKPEVRIGLRFGFPVENRTATSKVARTDLLLMQLEKQIEELDLQLSSTAVSIVTQIEQLEAVLELNREQIESAERKTQEELKLYDQGRGELTFVLQSRDSEQAASLTYAVNALSYQNLVLEYRALTDKLHR